MVNTFKTDIRNQKEADKIIALLQRRFPDSSITVNLEDPNRPLVIENQLNIQTELLCIMEIIGVYCELLKW